jgi:hypothetical protein
VQLKKIGFIKTLTVMKHLLLTTITAVLMAGCGESQQSSPVLETKPEPPVRVPVISIHEAAKRGNIQEVKQHIPAGTDVILNEKSFRVMNPLHYASGAGHREIVELLIAGGANVNTKTSFGFFAETPLDKAGAVFDQLNGGKILQEQYRCLNLPTGFPILIFQHPDC